MKFLGDAKDNHHHISEFQLAHWVFKLQAQKYETKIRDGSNICGEQKDRQSHIDCYEAGEDYLNFAEENLASTGTWFVYSVVCL